MGYKVCLEHWGKTGKLFDAATRCRTIITRPTGKDPLYELRWALRWAKGMRLIDVQVVYLTVMTKAQVTRTGLFSSYRTRRSP